MNIEARIENELDKSTIRQFVEARRDEIVSAVWVERLPRAPGVYSQLDDDGMVEHMIGLFRLADNMSGHILTIYVEDELKIIYLYEPTDESGTARLVSVLHAPDPDKNWLHQFWANMHTPNCPMAAKLKELGYDRWWGDVYHGKTADIYSRYAGLKTQNNASLHIDQKPERGKTVRFLSAHGWD